MSKLEQAIEEFMVVSEFAGVRREEIGGYVVSEFASMLPMMTEDEFDEHCDSISKHGLGTPIKLNGDGVIVDGRHRMLGCLVTGIEPKFVYTDLDDETEVVIDNLNRRHMDAGAKAMVWLKFNGNQKRGKAVETAAPDAREPRTNQRATAETVAHTETPKAQKTRKDAAKEAGVSARLMQQAANVFEKGTDELQQAVIDGNLSVKAAEKVAELPPEEQGKIVTSAIEGKDSKSSKAASREANESASIKTFDFSKWGPSFDKKVSKMLAGVPSDQRDRCQRHMAETLGSTVRVEMDTEQMLNAESIVPWVEDLIAGLAKSERASSELAIANRYASVVKIKDAEAAIIAIDTIMDGLSAAEKKKVVASLREQYAIAAGGKAPKGGKAKTLPMKPTAEVSRKA